MNIEEFREYCLSFKGSHDKMPFNKANSDYDKNIMTFSVMDKWFCFVNIENFDFCDLKCDPEVSKQLQDEYEGVTPGYHMNKEHWISVHFKKDVPKSKIELLVQNSYNLVVAGLTKKQQEDLAKIS
ncbi:MmcQ/YjbR family DNA-binding protein [Chitinophaga sancti]|uniref:MmcQ/YjbR family DNA-binding protein n=1 Tax=Chitinophaga sancti TaxID=1004 RepID=A0A1K1R597_9BACT|nr:MmcQ/YjbR family DNA-binding protein [Chitinophaga sancti]WQD64255.1 MmcQ/YjbR family DNA-binding protein [Chitinophaga sancti]WQG90121.1 MmcQ/YjbR family DNA-binding protein [Chitinophaga sancti]SFW67027.1 Predicted DNA-binding protein, MmcQ/YjbR family [Chitinophaga sancti]